MPPELKSIVDEYDRRQASMDRNMGAFESVFSGRYAAFVGMFSAFAVMYLMYALDDVTSELNRAAFGIIRLLGPDRARGILLRMASWGLLPKDYDKDDPYAIIEPQQGLRFITPVGLATGFDREGVGITAFLNMGFGFVDVGPVAAADGDAVEAMRQRISSRDTTGQLAHLGIVGATADGETAADLTACLAHLGRHVDYYAVNLGKLPAALREEDALRRLVVELVAASNAVPAGQGPAIFLRVPAKASREVTLRVAAAALAGGASGLVLCQGEADGEPDEVGEEAIAIISDVYRQAGGRLVLIASGGVLTGADALRRFEAGATVVQISSLLLTEGLHACRRLKHEIAALLMNQGYVQLQDAVGAMHRKKKVKAKNVWKPQGAAPAA